MRKTSSLSVIERLVDLSDLAHETEKYKDNYRKILADAHTKTPVIKKFKNVSINKYIKKFNEGQQSKLIEVLKDNEIAQNRLREIARYHIENDYDFESLISCLKKPERKNILNI